MSQLTKTHKIELSDFDKHNSTLFLISIAKQSQKLKAK